LVVGTQGVSPWRSLLEKFEPDGTSQWAVAVESSDPVAFNKVAVDHDDNIFFAGTSSMEDLDINGLILEDDEGGHNAFVVKLRPDGRPRWGAQMTSLEHGQHVNGLTVDSAGNATVLAWFFNQSVQIGSYLLTNSPLRRRLGGARRRAVDPRRLPAPC
jgi:hypothetical protein